MPIVSRVIIPWVKTNTPVVFKDNNNWRMFLTERFLPIGYVDTGRFHALFGRDAEAARWFRQAIAMNPTQDNTRVRCASIYVKMNDVAEAMQVLGDVNTGDLKKREEDWNNIFKLNMAPERDATAAANGLMRIVSIVQKESPSVALSFAIDVIEEILDCGEFTEFDKVAHAFSLMLLRFNNVGDYAYRWLHRTSKNENAFFALDKARACFHAARTSEGRDAILEWIYLHPHVLTKEADRRAKFKNPYAYGTLQDEEDDVLVPCDAAVLSKLKVLETRYNKVKGRFALNDKGIERLFHSINRLEDYKYHMANRLGSVLAKYNNETNGKIVLYGPCNAGKVTLMNRLYGGGVLMKSSANDYWCDVELAVNDTRCFIVLLLNSRGQEMEDDKRFLELGLVRDYIKQVCRNCEGQDLKTIKVFGPFETDFPMNTIVFKPWEKKWDSNAPLLQNYASVCVTDSTPDGFVQMNKAYTKYFRTIDKTDVKLHMCTFDASCGMSVVSRTNAPHYLVSAGNHDELDQLPGYIRLKCALRARDKGNVEVCIQTLHALLHESELTSMAIKFFNDNGVEPRTIAPNFFN